MQQKMMNPTDFSEPRPFQGTTVSYMMNCNNVHKPFTHESVQHFSLWPYTWKNYIAVSYIKITLEDLWHVGTSQNLYHYSLHL